MPRDLATRLADSRRTLETSVDVWVATAYDGAPWLVPLSLAWLDEHVVVAVPATSKTARGARQTSSARASVGHTRDVTMLDLVLEREVPVAEAGDLAAAYADRADWDPRGEEGYVYLVFRPTRVQAWREVDEMPGRTLMVDGVWKTPPA